MIHFHNKEVFHIFSFELIHFLIYIYNTMLCGGLFQEPIFIRFIEQLLKTNITLVILLLYWILAVFITYFKDNHNHAPHINQVHHFWHKVWSWPSNDSLLFASGWFLDAQEHLEVQVHLFGDPRGINSSRLDDLQWPVGFLSLNNGKTLTDRSLFAIYNSGNAIAFR